MVGVARVLIIHQFAFASGGLLPNQKCNFYLFLIYYTFAFQFHILIAPFHPVGFADFWLADQLNSLQTVLLDIEFFICFYSCEVGWFPNHSCKFGVIYRFCGPFYLHGNNYVDLCKGMSLIWRVC